MDNHISRNKARRLLGGTFDSSKTDAELTETLKTMGHCLSVRKGPSPVTREAFTAATESSPATDRLAVLRARQIAGKAVDGDEYEATRMEVIESANPKAHVLWLYLEKTYDCEVCELISEKGDLFGVKIRTPKGTFLDYVTRDELLRFLDSLGIRLR